MLPHFLLLVGRRWFGVRWFLQHPSSAELMATASACSAVIAVALVVAAVSQSVRVSGVIVVASHHCRHIPTTIAIAANGFCAAVASCL